MIRLASRNSMYRVVRSEKLGRFVGTLKAFLGCY